MEHVTTLCVLGTIGIAPAGLALGCFEHKTNTKRSRRKTVAHFTPSTPFGHAVLPGQQPNNLRPSTHTASSFFPGQATLSRDHQSFPRLEGYVEHVSSAGSTADGIKLRPRRQTYTNPPVSVSQEHPSARHSRRPSTSWLRRLSGVPNQVDSVLSTVSSLIDDPESVSKLPRVTSARRLPNKLIKRLPSHHRHSASGFNNDRNSHSSEPVRRRPATSYQRESSFFQLSVCDTLEFTASGTDADNDSIGSNRSENNPIWLPYFRPTCSSSSSDRFKRRLSTTGRLKERGLGHLTPTGGVAPALVSAMSVVNQNTTTMVTESNQFPRVEFRDPFNPAGALSELADTHSGQDRKKFRSSLSVFEEYLVALKEPTSRGAVWKSHQDFPKQSKERAKSTPLTDSTKGERTFDVFRRRSRRRTVTDITDPNVFCRPSTAPPSGFPISFQEKLEQSSGDVVFNSLSGKSEIGMAASHITLQPQRPSTAETPTLQSPRAFSQKFSHTTNSLERPRTKRASLAASEPASTLVGSDDTQIFSFGEEEETDYFSEAAFDSIRTRASINSKAERSNVHQEVLDDTLQPTSTQDKHEPFEDLATSSRKAAICSIEERVPLVTAQHHGCFAAGSSKVEGSQLTVSQNAEMMPLNSIVISSSLSDARVFKSFPSAPLAERDTELPLPASDLVNRADHQSNINEQNSTQTTSSLRSNLQSIRHTVSGSLGSSRRKNLSNSHEQSRKDPEQIGSDRRPNTVHGNQGGDVRGSRAPGRQESTTMHARSHSVPNAREPPVDTGSRKFGTWGLGYKGPSEDWDSDFDFDEGEECIDDQDHKVSKKTGVKDVVVPKAIMERQESVHGQFGQVQELTVLVEELRHLRHQASALQLVHGPSRELWKEAECIVHLATVNDEYDDDHNECSLRRSPSSITFSFAESEDDSHTMNDTSLDRDREHSTHSRTSGLSGFALGTSLKNVESTGNDDATLDMFYKRGDGDTLYLHAKIPQSQKLAFDKQTLCELVVRASHLTRSLKDVVREAESVATTRKDEILTSDPRFSRVFDQPANAYSGMETSCVG